MTMAESPSRFVITQPLASSKAKPETERARSLEERRLDSALAVAGARLGALEVACGAQAFVVSARALYDCAKGEARAGDLDAGWKFLHEARRELVGGMGRAEVESNLVTLGQEAEQKLGTWRREAVRTLIASVDADATLEQRREALRAAMAVRDEHCDNLYYRNRLLGRAVSTASAVLVVLGIALFAILWLEGGIPHIPAPGAALTTPLLAVGMLLGGMGACASALLGFARTPVERRMPEPLMTGLVTVMRSLVGAVAGLLAVLLVHAGVLNLGALSLVVPFVFGFGERLLVGALAKLQVTRP